MANNFFDDSNFEMEMLDQDQVSEEMGEYEPSNENNEEQYEEVTQEVSPSYSLNRQEKSVVGEAILRLEQARLYEMLLKHDFFGGVSNNQSAKQNVEQELKKFILDRLEILLGIKQESQQNAPAEVTVELPFNIVEIDFLKALAYQGTKGASGSANLAQTQAVVQPSLNQLPKLKQAETLRPLPQPKAQPQVKPVQAPVKQQQVQQPVRQPVKQQPVRQQVQQRPQPQVRKKARTLEEIAREDIAKMKNRKPAHEMSAKELAVANKKIEGGGNRKRPANALPMPSPEQQITNILTNKATNPNSTGDFGSILSRALGAVPLETINDD